MISEANNPPVAGAVRRLLIVSRASEPRGGADRIIVDLCRHLPKRGWDVVLGLTRGARFDNPDEYRKVYGDLPIVEFDGRLGTRRSRVTAIREQIRRVDPDVVLVMRVFDAYEATLREKHAGRRCRLVAGIRSYEPPYFADLIRYRDSIDSVVTSGELIADACRMLCGIEEQRVASIGGGVRAPNTPPERRTARKPVRLIYAGRLDRDQKRIMDVAPFLDELDRCHIPYQMDIAGSGPAETELRSLLAPRIAAGSVRMHGWVESAALFEKTYPATDVFVHFAAWEGMTIAPREAMAQGVVPVISQFTGQRAERQFIEGETALTFPVGDAAAAARCVGRLLNEPGLMERLSSAAAASQTGKYSFEGALDAWRDALNLAIDLPSKRGPIPAETDNARGRLARMGLPPIIEDTVRRLFGKPVWHSSPGSEWPTSSGRFIAEEKERYARFARERDGVERKEQIVEGARYAHALS